MKELSESVRSSLTSPGPSCSKSRVRVLTPCKDSEVKQTIWSCVTVSCFQLPLALIPVCEMGI